MTPAQSHRKTRVERITEWIGSVMSLAVHTTAFLLFFALSTTGILSWDLMFLILTTVVSLEAIYLAIFIQMTVNRHSAELEEVSEDVEDIQEDVQEMQESVEDIQEDVQEMQEDVEELSEEDAEEEVHHARQLVTLERLTADVQRVLKDLETLRQEKG